MSPTQPGAMDPNEPVGRIAPEPFNARAEFAILLQRLAHAEQRIAALEAHSIRVGGPEPAYSAAVKSMVDRASGQFTDLTA